MDLRDALLAAIAAGDADAVRSLLATDPSLAGVRDGDGVSAILLACYRWQPAIVELLRAAGPTLDAAEATALGDAAALVRLLAADPAAATARTADGFTPLHYAAFFGGPEVARILLDAGADPGLRSENGFAVMPLHSAVAAGRTEVALQLIAAGADPDPIQRHGWTPLHGAADNGLAAVVDALLAAGADPGRTLDDGRSAAQLADEKGHATIAARIRAAGG